MQPLEGWEIRALGKSVPCPMTNDILLSLSWGVPEAERTAVLLAARERLVALGYSEHEARFLCNYTLSGRG